MPDIEPHPVDDHHDFDGKVIEFEVGWDGENGSIKLSGLLAVAAREYPNIPLSEIGITISQEKMIVVHPLAVRR